MRGTTTPLPGDGKASTTAWPRSPDGRRDTTSRSAWPRSCTRGTRRGRSGKWVGCKHSFKTSRKWRAEGHVVESTMRWGKHSYDRSRQWSHSYHAVEESQRRRKKDGHSSGHCGSGGVTTTRTIAAQPGSTGSPTFLPDVEDMEALRPHGDDSWKWRAVKPLEAPGMKRVGRHDEAMTRYGSESLSRRWRGGETATRHP